jgi:hypothetical protein
LLTELHVHTNKSTIRKACLVGPFSFSHAIRADPPFPRIPSTRTAKQQRTTRPRLPHVPRRAQRGSPCGGTRSSAVDSQSLTRVPGPTRQRRLHTAEEPLPPAAAPTRRPHATARRAPKIPNGSARWGAGSLTPPTPVSASIFFAGSISIHSPPLHLHRAASGDKTPRSRPFPPNISLSPAAVSWRGLRSKPYSRFCPTAAPAVL